MPITVPKCVDTIKDYLSKGNEDLNKRASVALIFYEMMVNAGNENIHIIKDDDECDWV